MNNCYVGLELNHYLGIIIIIIQSYSFILILKDHDKTSLNHSSSFFLSYSLL